MVPAFEIGHSIAILGGTGALGSGLAQRWARAGHAVIIGSRDPAKAQDALASEQSSRVRVLGYADAAAAASIAVLTVPFASQIETLTQVAAQLQGKILIDCTVPLCPPKVGRVQLPQAGSAAQVSQAFLGEGVTVVSAFQNVSAALLRSDETIDCDVLVCSDSIPARGVAIQLAAAAGLRGISAGPLANSAAADALTSILITINRQHKSGHAGIRITGIAELCD